MIVRCITQEITPNVEVHSKSNFMRQESISVGEQYLVFSIYVPVDDDLFRSHVRLLVEVRPYLLASVPARFFEVVDGACPGAWEVRLESDGSATIGPLLLATPHLVEDAADGDPAARHTVDVIRRLLEDSEKPEKPGQ